MSRTSIGTREVRDGSVARSDVNITSSGESLITKVIAGTDVGLTWTGADPGTGDVTINFTGGAATAIPLESYELADWYGGQQLTATPITINLDGPRYTNSKFSNNNGELTFLEEGPYLVLARVTADITSGTNRSESEMYCEQDTGSGWNLIYGTKSILYHRNNTAGGNTGTALFLFDAAVNDKIRIRALRTTGSSTIETVDDGSNLLVISLKGTRGDQGPQGQDGIDGADGLNGADGSMIYNGTTTPDNSLGKDTDLYINTTTNEYYQKVGGDWGSPIGTLGNTGGSGDHGALAGLADDDHPQYLNNSRGDARYAAINHTHSSLTDLDLRLQKLEVLQWMGSD